MTFNRDKHARQNKDLEHDSFGYQKLSCSSVFISYLHQDEAPEIELLEHLDPLRRLGLIANWHDRKIEPGDKWVDVISENLKKADIVIVLVGIDFINSRHCYEVEMDAALDRQADGATIVVR